jgi:hypothetical protein
MGGLSMQLSGLKLAGISMVFNGRSCVFDVLNLNPLCGLCSSGEALGDVILHGITQKFTEKRGAMWH